MFGGSFACKKYLPGLSLQPLAQKSIELTPEIASLIYKSCHKVFFY